MFLHSVVPIIIHDLEMNIYDANQSAIEQFGYTLEELQSIKVYELHPDDTLKQSKAVRSRMEKEESLKVEARFKRKDGSIFTAEATPTKYILEGKPLIHVYLQDITQRKQDELQILEALRKAEESDRLKSKFLANISHEIRTPLTGIIGFSSVLKKEDLPGEVVKKYSKNIYKSGKHLLNLINNIIDLSTIEAGKSVITKEEVDLEHLLQEVFEFFYSLLSTENNEKLTLRKETSSGKSKVVTDPLKLKQILINLINNAIKYTEDGEVVFGYEEKSEKLCFYVKDTGIGIPEAEQKKVFERFHQGSSSPEIIEGTGLGLSIAKACTELLGGEIWFQSTEGKGTSFFFTIDQFSQ